MGQSATSRRKYAISAIVALAVACVSVIMLMARGANEDISWSSEYSESDLALLPIIDEEFALSQPWVRSPTSDSGLEQVDQNLEQFYGLRGHHRERRYFEFQLTAVISDALQELEGELDFYNGRLARAFDDAFERCALANEIPGGGVTLSSLARDYIRVLDESTFDLSEDELVRIRHECAREASAYPTLPTEERDELVQRTLDATGQHVNAWMEANPHLVVPVEYHLGVNQPYADALTEFCRQAPKPRECAREAGVDLEGG